MKVRLLMALHFHQPIGNFDSVFEDAVRLCYAPVVGAFERHSGVRAAFHLSGCLLEWLERHDRPFLDRVLALVASRRIEPLGGAFYEPILPILPRADALDQIERLAAWWQRRSGVRPAGAWLPERVWEPSLAELLAEAGVGYTILDDQHLRFAGLLDERFSGMFATERAGRGVAFFPTDFQLRYLIPFRTMEAVREHFQRFAAGDREWVLTYGDDAEKFGLWPGTHRWVHEEGWLEKFFAFLEEKDGPVRADSPGACFAERPPARKVYVPNASYTEMLEWALPEGSAAAYARTRQAALDGAPAESVRAFVRGSLWDMFLARYPESDQLHKHVLWSSARARALPADAPGREEAITGVLRAQGNCPYWHGLFGGIYFPHLRHGAYQSLLGADAVLARAEGGEARAEARDLDGDLEEEIVLRGAEVQAFLRPGDAGTLFELDYLPARFNVTNVVSRWKESYHSGADLTHVQPAAAAVASPHERPVGLGKADLEGRYFDALPLRSLREFRSASPPTSAALVSFEGMDLARGRLESWETTAHGFRGRGRLGPLRFEKSVELAPPRSLEADWDLRGSEAQRDGWFGAILALTLLAREAPDRSLVLTDSRGRRSATPPGASLEGEDVARITLEDRAFGFALDLEPSPAAHLATCPIETLQRSEDRAETAYQGTLFALCWSAAGTPKPGLRWTFRRL